MTLEELRLEKATLIQEKMRLQTVTSDLNTEFRTSPGRMPRDKYRRLLNDQSDVKADLMEIDRKLVMLKVQIQNASQPYPRVPPPC